MLLVAGVAAVGLATFAWGVRLLASDTVPALQQVAWIPAPVVAGVVLLGTGLLVLGAKAARSGRAVAVAAAAGLTVFFAVSIDFLATRWGWSRACDDPVRILHWNATSPSAEDTEAQRVDLADREWEVLVISNDATLFGRWFAHRWKDGPRGESWPVRRAGPFALVTEHPVLESRLAIASGGIWLGVFRIRLPVAGGRELVLHVLDLPSDPKIARGPLLADLRQRLDALDLPEPDLVLGDVNLDAGSRSLSRAYPALDPAFAVAGEGHAASYPRRWPLWQTDQMLVSPQLPVCRYRFIDLGFGTHRAQELSIERDAEEAGADERGDQSRSRRSQIQS